MVYVLNYSGKDETLIHRLRQEFVHHARENPDGLVNLAFFFLLVDKCGLTLTALALLSNRESPLFCVV